MAKRLSKAKAKKAMKAFIESEERQQSPEEKRKNAWFPMHIQSIIDNKDNICYENGRKTGEGLVKGFSFTISEAWKFAEGLKLFYSGVVNAIEKTEAEMIVKPAEAVAEEPHVEEPSM